jgi:hypothetical protein
MVLIFIFEGSSKEKIVRLQLNEVVIILIFTFNLQLRRHVLPFHIPTVYHKTTYKPYKNAFDPKIVRSLPKINW